MYNEYAIKAVAFSKNRPVQLYALLESFFINCHDDEFVDFSVLFKSSPEYIDAYKEVISRFKSVKFVEETDFRSDLFRILAMTDAPYFMPLVDDIVFIDDFSAAECGKFMRENEDCLTLSLRLGVDLNYCYSMCCEQPIPKFHDKWGQILKFYHRNEVGDWGYPFSLDGNIFNRKEFAHRAFSYPFTSPNHLESRLSTQKSIVLDDAVGCYEKPKLFNIPDNRVQNDFQNRYETQDGERLLLDKWNDGMKIDIEKLKRIPHNSCHFPVEFEFAKR